MKVTWCKEASCRGVERFHAGRILGRHKTITKILESLDRGITDMSIPETSKAKVPT